MIKIDKYLNQYVFDVDAMQDVIEESIKARNARPLIDLFIKQDKDKLESALITRKRLKDNVDAMRAELNVDVWYEIADVPHKRTLADKANRLAKATLELTENQEVLAIDKLEANVKRWEAIYVRSVL